jgi:phosphomannomutase
VTNLVEAPTPTNIVFGTDGWRARMADDFTFENVRRCADGVAHYVEDRGEQASKGVVIAYDRRFASEHFAGPPRKSCSRGTSRWRSRSPPCPPR